MRGWLARTHAYAPFLSLTHSSTTHNAQVGPGNTAEHVGGPDACEVNDRCSGDSPLQIQAAAQEQTSMDLSIPSTNFMPYVDDDGQLQNSDVTLLWHELTVYCHSTDDGVDDYTVTVRACMCACFFAPGMRVRTDTRASTYL